MPHRRPSKERRELSVGITHTAAIASFPDYDETKHEVCHDPQTGLYQIFNRRKATDSTIRKPLARLTVGTFRVQGVTRDPMRQLWVEMKPGDVLSFTPKGTRQTVSVPIASLYHHARFIAARAVANAKRAARAAKKGGRR